MIKKGFDYKKALNTIVINMWFTNNFINIKFLFLSQYWSAKMVMQVIIINKIYQELYLISQFQF